MPALARVDARACCRVDFAGGTLDIWPLGLLHQEARTVNVAISLEARVRLTPRSTGFEVDLGDDRPVFASAAAMMADERTALVGGVVDHFALPPCEIRPASDSPRGAGIAGSSALEIALIAAAERFLGLEASTPDRRSALARDLEAKLMSLPTGRQDHYPALVGGALEIRHLAGEERVRRLRVDLPDLGRHLVVAFTGKSHFSAGNNWEVVRRRLDGDAESRRLFDGIAEVAAEVPAVLEASDYSSLGELMSREWSFRRELAEGISTPRLERLLRSAREEGAWGGKACGAGGGGCVAVLCPAGRRPAVERALVEAGAEILDAQPSDQGVSVSAASPEPAAR